MYSTAIHTVQTSIRELPLTSVLLPVGGKAPVRTPKELEKAVPEVVHEQPKLPRQYKVVVLNDDYTPMDFVVQVLELFFGLSREQATRIMLKVHTEGRAVCGVYSRDIAEAKAEQVNRFARDNKHPLLCQIEMAESGGDNERT